MSKLSRLLVVTVLTVASGYFAAATLDLSGNEASASSTSWNPVVRCVPVVATIEQILGTQTNSYGGATQAGGWYGGQTIPDKTSLTPPCTVNGAPMFVEVHDVNVEGFTCNSFTGGNDGDCWGNLWDNSSGSMTYLNQIHAEIAGTWITAGIAPSVPSTNTQIDVQGFVYWDPYHLTDAWHSYSGWEIHPVAAWRTTVINDFSMTVSPSSGAVTAGSSTVATVSTTVTGGSSQQLSFSASGLPAGASVTFNPSQVASGSSTTMTITAGSSTPVGTYPVTVTASGSSMVHSVAYSLTVNGPASTSISNGGFETGNLTGWTPAGSASVTTSSPHSGSYAAMLGLPTATNGDSSVRQSFLAPSGGTVSFWYSIHCPDTVSYDWGTVTLTDNSTGTTTTPLPRTCPSSSAWSQAGATLTGGDYYTLALVNHDDNNTSDPTYTEYDDVAIQAASSSLAAPTGLTATPVSTSEIDLSWTAVSGATGYTVQRSPDGSTWSTIGTPATTGFADTNLTAATTYYYRVDATNGSSSSPYSATVAAATLSATALSAPTGLRAAALSATSTTMSWGASSGGTSYEVQRSPDGSTTWTKTGTTTQTSFTDSGLSAATNYYYRVIALTSTGSSAPSASVAVTTFVAPCPCTAWPPSSTPTVSAASDTSANELGVKFRVDLSGTVTGLRFYKGTGNTGTHTAHLWTRGGTLLASATFTNETATGWQQVSFATPVTVAAGTTYVASYFAPSGHYAADQNYFATQGVDTPPVHLLANGVDGYDGVYKWQSSGFPTSSYKATNYWVDIVFNANPPATPTSVTASAQPAGQITVSWAAVTGASSYSIAYSADGVSGWTVVGSTAQTSWIDVRPVAGAANYYQVSAISAGGSSPPSAVVSATPS